MTTELGTELGTTLGTNLGSMDVFGAPAFDASKVYALANLTSATDLYQTQAAGGEAGIASGFGAILLYQMLASGSERIFHKYTTGAGYTLDRSAPGTNTATWYAHDGTAVLRSVTLTFPTPPNFGQIFAVLLRHNGTSIDGWVYGQPKPTPFAVTGYTPGTTVQQMRGSTTSTSALLGSITFRGIPTDNQVVAVINAARTALDLPAKATAEALMPGVTVTHRWSLRDVLAAANVPVADGAAAPASIPDSVTLAAADAMAKVGSPIIRVLDSAAYPRTRYGVLGASGTSYLESAVGAGIAGSAAGFHVVDVINPLTLTGTQMFAHALNDAGNRGWYFQAVGGVLKFAAENTSGVETASPGYTITAGDVNTPLWVAGQVTAAGVVRLFVRGVQIGADTASMGTFGPSTGSMRVSVWKTATPQQSDSAWYGLAGGSDVSIGELQQNYADYLRTGRVQPIAGKAQHLYDPTLDVNQNGGPGNGVPATVLDRIGTDHLTRVGGLAVQNGGLSKFQTTNFAQTAVLSTPGVATGFYAEALVDVTTLSGQQGWFAATSDAGFTTGFVFANNAGKLNVWAGGGTVAAGANLSLGRRHVALRYDGSVLRGYVDGTLIGTSASYTHVPTTVPTTIGGIRASSILWPVTSDDVLSAAYGPGAVTDPQIATAASAALSAGKCVGIGGVTTKMWHVVDDVTAAGGVPRVLVERVSGATADIMVLANPKLEVAARTERLWSYETTPIMYGAQGWSAANYLSRAGGAGAFLATSAPWWLAIAVVVQAVPGAGVELIFGGSNGSNPGFQVYFQASSAQAAMALSPSGSVNATAASIASTDVGKVLLLGYQWTGGALQTYIRRAKQGADVTAASFVPNTNGAFFLGRRFDTTSNPLSSGTYVLGVMGGSGNFTLAEWQAAYDALGANEALTAIPGKTDRLWRFGQGGTLGTTADAMGNTDAITVVGSPTLASLYTRGLG